MTKARNIADLLDANGDIVSSALDNVPASNDASALTTGTIDNARISLDANEIPNLDTAKITTGTFADARLPSTALNSNVDLTNLSASNLTSGTLADARFPATLPAVSGANLTNLPGGSDFVKLGTVDVTSAVSSVSFDGLYSSSYDYYKVFISDVNQSYDNGAPLRMRFNKSGSAVVSTNYVTRNSYAAINTMGSIYTTETHNSWVSEFELAYNTGGTQANCSIELNIPNPLKSNSRGTFNSTYGGYNQSSIAVFTGQNAGCLFNNNGAYTGVTIFPASGTIDTGRFTMYGVKH